MISIRLPWRPRARPSATLHEIPICSVKSKLEKKITTDRTVCQADFPARCQHLDITAERPRKSGGPFFGLLLLVLV